jgi:Reverse transcriptase (RNA-dependent DNA polymerase)
VFPRNSPQKVKKFGITDNQLNWFSSYLCNRFQKVDINGKFSNDALINISVMQGTILGPILFLCYINDIHTATKLLTILFADDTSCLAEHKDLNELIVFVNQELKKLANWFLSNKMAVNISKTKYIIFRSKGKRIENQQQILFNNNEIGMPENPNLIFPLERVYCDNPNPEHKFYKLLGCYFDEYLSFDKHVDYICAKISRANFCIKRVSNDLSLKALRSLYFALVHPHLLYCSIILSCASVSAQKRILILQKKAIRIINKQPVSAHTTPLFSASNILPFDHLVLYNKLLFMHAIYYKYSPKSLHDMFPTNAARNLNVELRNIHEVTLPFVRIDWFKKFPLYSLPSAWNDLGTELTHQNNKMTFSILLKEHLFRSMYAGNNF